jgi:hypothetical protein
VAKQALAAIGPTTKVGLQQNVTVAGQAAYQISLAPKDSRSLIGEIRIAVDAQRALPLRVQIFARGSGRPAFQVGFTSLQFGTPAAGNFAFTAPPGAKVKTVTVPAGAAPGLLRGLPLGLMGAGGPLAGVRGHALVRIPATVKGKQVMLKGIAPAALRRAAEGHGLPSGAGPTVLGKDWLTVVVIPASGLAAASTGQLFGAAPAAGSQAGGGLAYRSHLTIRVRGSGATSQEVIRAQAPAGPQQAIVVPGGPDLAILGALLKSAKPVHGTWGSGRLLTTSLVSVLATSNGKILVGAVTPAVLYADAAQVK